MSGVEEPAESCKGNTIEVKFPCDQCAEVRDGEADLGNHRSLSHPSEIHTASSEHLEVDGLPPAALDDDSPSSNHSVTLFEQNREKGVSLPGTGDAFYCQKCSRSFRVRRHYYSHICLADDYVSGLKKSTHKSYANVKLGMGKRKTSEESANLESPKVIKVVSLQEISDEIKPKIFTCHECFKEFSSKSNLNNHMTSQCRKLRYPDAVTQKGGNSVTLKEKHESTTSAEKTASKDEYPQPENATKDCTATPSLAEVINECISDHKIGKESGYPDEQEPSSVEILTTSPYQSPLESLSDEDEAGKQAPAPRKKGLKNIIGKCFGCELCDEVFSQSSMLEAHIESIHFGKKFRCDICAVEFKRKANFVRHNSKMHSNVISANVHNSYRCLKAFATKYDLERHKNAHFVSEENSKDLIQCRDCNMVFIYKKDLKRHQKETHKVTPQITDEPPVIIPDFIIREHGKAVSVFRCSICPRAFSLKTDLQRHFLIHSGEKPFACDLCDSRFNRKSNLMRHKRLMHHVSEERIKPEISKRRKKKGHVELEPWEEEIRRQDEEIMKWQKQEQMEQLEKTSQNSLTKEVAGDTIYWEQEAEAEESGDSSLQVAIFHPEDKITVRILTFE